MKSIRRQLTLVLLVYGPGLLLVGFSILYVLMREQIYRQFDESLKASTRLVAEEIEENVADMGREGILAELKELQESNLLPDYYNVTTLDGKTIAGSARSHQGQEAPWAMPPAPDHDQLRDFLLPNGDSVRAYSLRGGAGDTAFLVTLMHGTASVERTLHRLLLVVVVTGIVLALLAVFVVPAFLRQALAPVGIINRTIAEVDVGTLDQRVPTAELPLELRPVAQRLNELLDRLELAFARERRVNADLAHELRTPLAELKLLSETNLKWPDSRDPGTDEDMAAIARQLEGMVERMLTLARSEAGLLVPTREIVAVDALVQSVGESLARRAADRGLNLRIESQPVSVAADPVLLRAILTNLLDNALTHAPERSDVGIEVAEHPGNRVRVTLSNDAPSLTLADLRHIGDRYWRKDSAREGNHLGIGGAIAASLCEAMGASISYSLSPDQRLAVEFVVGGNAVADRATDPAIEIPPRVA